MAIAYEFHYGWRCYDRRLAVLMDDEWDFPPHFQPQISKFSPNEPDLPRYLRVFATVERKHAVDPDKAWQRMEDMREDPSDNSFDSKASCQRTQDSPLTRASSGSPGREPTPDIFGDGPLPTSFEELERRYKEKMASSLAPQRVKQESPARGTNGSRVKDEPASPPMQVTVHAAVTPRSPSPPARLLPSSFIREPLPNPSGQSAFPHWPIRSDDESVFLSALLYSNNRLDTSSQ